MVSSDNIYCPIVGLQGYMILFHGTTEENAKCIMKEGFKPDKNYNWQIKS